MRATFKKCFKAVLNNQDNKPRLHCSRPIAYSECVEYCEWHKNYVQNTDFEELLTLMKFGLPQRKWITNSVSVREEKIAAKLFSDFKTVKTVKSNRSPLPFSLLCHIQNTGYIGENIGLSEPVCQDFFPSPTDQGICMTENINIKEILHDYKKYEELMEPNLQKHSSKIEGGTLWSKKTFIISLKNDPWLLDHPRSNSISDLQSIQMKLHQFGDFGNFMPEAYFIDHTEPISLNIGIGFGHEYFIDVTPVGMRSSNNLKSLSVEQRGCLLENEVQEGSMFKKYSQFNCKYECRIALSKDICQCIPWDFISDKGQNNHECDVFGRTCFFNAMKYFSKKADDLCPHCKKACDYTHYKMSISKVLEMSYFDNTNTSFLPNFINNNQYLLWDKSWIYGDSRYPSNSRNQFHDTLIRVHLRFLEPKLEIADASYSTWDKFANFGGNFGIFAEITGISFLGMLNFVILIAKFTTSRIFYRCKYKLKMLMKLRRKRSKKVVPKCV